jgi:hypothetical protein
MKHAHKTIKTFIPLNNFRRNMHGHKTMKTLSTSHVNICPLGRVSLIWLWNLGSTLQKATMVNLLSNRTFYNNWNKMGPTSSFKVQSTSSK